MAIALLIARFLNRKPRRPMPGYLAYLGRRSTTHDGQRFTYSHLSGDLVYEAMLLPPGAPPDHAAPLAFARALDAAEPPQIPGTDRLRFPQTGLDLVLALPSDAELTLDEAIALARRLVAAVVGDLPVGAYLCLHDPAVRHPTRALRNRHAHVVIALRPYDGGRLSRHKLRDLVARVRTAGRGEGQDRRPVFVAEGVAWPDLWWGLQNRAFFELGLSTRVQPIAARPERHFGRQMSQTKPREIAAARADLVAENRRIAFGSPPVLVRSLARGRSTVLVADLRAFLTRVIVDPSARHHRLTAILGHPAIVGVPSVGGVSSTQTVDRITTRTIHLRTTRALRIAQANVGVAAPTLVCVRATGGTLTADLHRAVADHQAGTYAPGPVVAVGAVLSHAEDLAAPVIAHHRLRDVIGRANAVWSPSTLIVAPRAHALADGDLASLVINAGRAGATLILGVDDAAADGVIERRLATVIAGLLAPRDPRPDLTVADLRRLSAQRLRMGFIREGLAALMRSGALRFESPAPEDDRITVGNPFPPSADAKAAGSASRPSPDPVWHPTVGERLIALRTDYGHLPPVIRAGRVYVLTTIHRTADGWPAWDLRSSDSDIPVSTTQGVDLFAPLANLSLRQARALEAASSPYRVVVASGRTAWAALLLASEASDPTVPISVLPAVATSLDELVAVVGRSLPAALAGEFPAVPNRAARNQAQEAVLVDALVERSKGSGRKTTPDQRSGSTHADLRTLPPGLAAAVHNDPLVRTGLQAHIETVRTTTGDPSSITGAAMDVLDPVAPRPKRDRRPKLHAESTDLPIVLADTERAELSAWDLYKVELELKQKALSTLQRPPIIEGQPAGVTPKSVGSRVSDRKVSAAADSTNPSVIREPSRTGTEKIVANPASSSLDDEDDDSTSTITKKI